MFSRYRQRRGPYAMANPSAAPSALGRLLLLCFVLLIVFIAGRWIVGFFGRDGEQSRAVVASVERGSATVSFEGELLQPAAESMKLHEGDRIVTGSNGSVVLAFFDGTRVRLDADTDVTVDESELGTEESSLALTVEKGAVWIRTPTADAFSGGILRSVSLPSVSFTLPSDTEAILEETDVFVFRADGDGLILRVRGISDPFAIGEGQQWKLPAEEERSGDMLAFRSAIDPSAIQRPFIEESRLQAQQPVAAGSGGTLQDEEEMLTVTSPGDNAVLDSATVQVKGTVASRVDRVRVNGYMTTLDRSQGSFSQELTLREGEDTVIRIEALDPRGLVLAETSRTVRRGTMTAPTAGAPVITVPAANGETYRTQKTELEIKGNVPADATGIIVNDYKLQLFRSGDKTWSYLASTALKNFKEGTNVYDVYALDASGNKSAPARITILLEPGTEGVVGSASSAVGASSTPASAKEEDLPKNAPLKPGSVTVTGPAPGTSFTATGSEFLLEGTAPKETKSVWVNGYRLQLYTPGKTFWNYIAKVDYGTLKKGTNTYRIVARDGENRILDALTYTVEY